MSRDPGVPFAYAGYLFLVLGAFVSGFVIPRRFTIGFSQQDGDRKGTRIEIWAEKAHRDTTGLKREAESVMRETENVLEGGKK